MQNPVVENPYEPKKSILLSERLLNKQNCWSKLDELKTLHLDRMRIEFEMTKHSNKKSLKSLMAEYTKNQFALQEAWGFPQNANFHKWWYLPNCSCPKMDNDDRYPYGCYIVSGSCDMHAD